MHRTADTTTGGCRIRWKNTQQDERISIKPEKQRIAIAEACGWKCCEPKPRVKDSPHARWMRGDDLREFRNLPNFPNDLNACHEAEETLTGEQSKPFAETLGKIVYGRNFDPYDRWHWHGVVHATAAQRAEAFLKTIGKWEEGK